MVGASMNVHYIFQTHVPMDDIILVEVVHSLDDLSNNPGRLLFSVLFTSLLLRVDFLEQLSSFQILKANINSLVVFKILLHVHDIGVAERFYHVNFFFIATDVQLGHESLLHNFDCHFIIRQFVDI